MKLNQTCRELNQLLESLDYEYDMNSGGCAFVAYSIAKNLSEKNIPYEVVLYPSIWVNTGGPREIYKEHKSVHHVLVLCDSKYLLNDTGYSLSKETIKKYKISLTPGQVRYYYKTCRWNPRYDKKYNSVISRKINNFFKQLE